MSKNLIFIANNDVDARNIYYIDPTYGVNGDGSISNPYNTFVGLTIQSNTIYLLKRGTTYTSSSAILLSSLSNVRLDTYGDSSDKPSFVYTGLVYQGYAIRFNSCTSCVLFGWDITTTQKCIGAVRIDSGSNNIVNNCKIHDIPGDGTVDYSGIGIRGGGTSLRILNCEICYVACDGMYISTTTNLEIGYCNIHHVNQYYVINPDQTYSNGDGIQLDGLWQNFYIHHCNIDRSDEDTGNKSGIILNSGEGVSDDASGIVEYNTFKKNNNVNEHLLVERGLNIIVRYNIFKEDGLAMKIGGKSKNTLVHNNIFYGCGRGIMVAYTGDTKTYYDKIYNNVFYGLTGYNPYSANISPPGGFHIQIDTGVKIEAKNNIHLRTTDYSVAIYRFGSTAEYVISNNCYGDISTAGSRGTGTNPQIGDPSFINPSNFDFHIDSDSICINNGLDLGLTHDFDNNTIPRNGGYDIGAYEYVP